MNIIVCVKQVIDPEAPPSSFRIDAGTGKAEMRDASPVIDPYAEYAVEAALKLRESAGGKITILSLGNQLLREIVKKPLAMGADELVLLEDEAFAGGDSWQTASFLTAAVRKIGEYDVILCGREASDTNAGQTGPGIAELLGIPCVTLARKIESGGGALRVERATSEGYEVVEVAPPVVITASNEIGEPRYPTIKGIMAAKKKEPVVWKPADIDTGSNTGKTEMNKIFQPVIESQCEFATGDSPEEAAADLAQKLRGAKVI